MYKALIAFTALLGLFSFYSKAAPDDGSTCRENALSSQSAVVRFVGASSCSDIGSVFTGNDHCQVRASPGATCTQDQFGVWVGQPYYFTGCLAGTQCSFEPNEPEYPDDEQLNEVPDLVWGNASELPPNAMQVGSGFAQTIAGLKYLSANDFTINENIKTLQQRMSDSIFSVNAVRDSVNAKTSQILTSTSSIQQQTTDVLAKVSETNSQLTDVKTIVQDMEVTSAQDALDNKQLHQQTHDSQTEAKNSLDAITSKLPLLDAINTRAGLASDYSSNAAYSAQQANLAANDAATIGVMAYQAATSAMDNTNAIYSMVYEMYESGSGGGGGNMDQTNDLLAAIKSDLSFNTDRIVSELNGPAGLPVLHEDLLDINANLGYLSSLYDELVNVKSGVESLSSQLGNQLDDIKTAIENDPGGGGSIPDDLLDVTNQELSQLRQLVASNHAASQEQLQNLNTTASGQSEQLSSLSTAVSGIGESLDSIKSGLSGSAYESPSMSDSDIKDSLGVGEVVGREDLFTDDIELDSFTGSYTGWISTSTCPDIPPFELPFDIKWKLDLKLFCDALGIFGVFVMAAAYFSVPFIVFGGKK